MFVRYTGIDDYYADVWKGRCAYYKVSPNAVYEASPSLSWDYIKILNKDGVRLLTISRENFYKFFEIVNYGIQKKLGDYL